MNYSELAAALRGDGCTSSPDLWYRGCCDAHDVHYRTGCDLEGNPITRKEADRQLRRCMAQSGKTPVIGRWLLPWLYWAAVRAFGRRAWKGSNSSDSRTMPSAPASSPD